MAQSNIYKAAMIIEKRRLGDDAVGIPTTSDMEAARAIDALYEASVPKIKADALEEAERAYNSECLGFQRGWGSNEIDVAKLDMLNKTIDWLKARKEKYLDVLPRRINLNNTYRSLSDGAKIELDRIVYVHRIGFGDFVSDDNAKIRGNGSSNREVTLIDHNLEAL